MLTKKAHNEKETIGVVKHKVQPMGLTTPTSVYGVNHYSPISDHYRRNNDVSTKEEIIAQVKADKTSSDGINKSSDESTVSEETSVTGATDDDTNTVKKNQLNSTNNNIVKTIVVDLTGDSDVGEEYYVTKVIPSQVIIDLTNDDTDSDTDNGGKRKQTETKVETPSKVAKHLHITLVSQTLHYESDEI